MTTDRVFASAAFMQPSDTEPIRSVITETAELTVVAWLVLPGQTIAPHVHPAGSDTWTVLSGEGDYLFDAEGSTRRIGPGDVAVAPAGAVHGVVQRGREPLRFVSVVAPLEAGYVPLGAGKAATDAA